MFCALSKWKLTVPMYFKFWMITGGSLLNSHFRYIFFLYNKKLRTEKQNYSQGLSIKYPPLETEKNYPFYNTTISAFKKYNDDNNVIVSW